MNLTPTTSLESDDTVTRQTLYNFWADANVGEITFDEIVMEPGQPPVLIGSEATSTPAPGQIWFDQTEQVWKVFIDMVDNTACSVWCAFGPDRFDEPMWAGDQIPGYGVVIHGCHAAREARLPSSGAAAHEWHFGINAADDTVASGAWFACAVEGLTYARTIDASTNESYAWGWSGSVNAFLVMDKRGNGGVQILKRGNGTQPWSGEHYLGFALGAASDATYAWTEKVPIMLWCPGTQGSDSFYS